MWKLLVKKNFKNIHFGLVIKWNKCAKIAKYKTIYKAHDKITKQCKNIKTEANSKY